jgi:hypothetical protein
VEGYVGDCCGCGYCGGLDRRGSERGMRRYTRDLFYADVTCFFYDLLKSRLYKGVEERLYTIYNAIETLTFNEPRM